ncbi:MAG: glycosyltransferase [Bacteroides sp.]
MKVTVVDCSVSGHRETYYKQFCRTLLAMGHETSLIAPDGSGLDASIRFEPIRTRRLLALPAGNTLKKKWIVLCNALILCLNLAALHKQLREIHPDRVFFACLDDMLPTCIPLWLFDRLLPYRWSGLLVQASLPKPRLGIVDARRCLRAKYCTGVGVLNEYAVDELKPFQSHILLFPDFADTSAPNTAYPLREQIRTQANGRNIIALLGSVHTRKGTDLFIQTAGQLPPDAYFFVIAGKSSLDESQEAALQRFAQTHENCLFSLERIPDESCFNALVEESTLLFAVYRNFKGSSNMLTKAALFGKPIIVSQGYCMGHRVDAYHTGMAIGETDPAACATAIEHLCTHPQALSEARFDLYARDHSTGKLTECFHQLLNDLS